MAVKGQKKVIYVLNMKRLISLLPPDAVDSPVAAAHWFGPTAEMCVCVHVRVPSRTRGFLGIAPKRMTSVSLPLIIFLFIIFFCFLYTFFAAFRALFQPPSTPAAKEQQAILFCC